MIFRTKKILAALCLPLLFSHCRSDDSKITNVNDETYMEARIDGRIWKASFVTPSRNNLNGSTTLLITGGRPSDQNLEAIIIQLHNVAQPDSFAFDTSSTPSTPHVSASYTRGTEIVPEDFIAVSGFVNLTVRDEQNVSGTFEFQGVEQSDSSKTVSVTEGKFGTPLK